MSRAPGVLRRDRAGATARTGPPSNSRYPAFAVNAPGFAEPDYAMRRHAGGGRKDVMSVRRRWAGLARCWSRSIAPAGNPALRRCGERGRRAHGGAGRPLLRSSRPSALDGKFGRVTAFEFTATVDGRARNCLGFARAFGEPRLQIAGWYCKADAEVVDRRTLACAIEGLDAARRRERAEGAAAVRRRRAEAQVLRTRATSPAPPTIRRNDWIEARSGPKLRRSVATR